MLTTLVMVVEGCAVLLFSIILEGELGLCMDVILMVAWFEVTGLGKLGTFFELSNRIFFLEFDLFLASGELSLLF